MIDSDKKITKAVFPVAGFGTRFLPATKAMPKELLPIIDKPLIQYAAEEAVSAGIETLIFVTGRNKRAIEDHFDRNHELEKTLLNKGKTEQADMIKSIVPKNVECIFVRQPEQLGLGHAVFCARRAVGNEPFVVILADDFLHNENGNVTNDLLRAYSIGCRNQLCVMKVDGEDISKYGVIDWNPQTRKVRQVVEKPSLKNAPSDMASIGRYILNPNIFEILETLHPGVNNEIQLTDALNLLALAGEVEAVKMKAKRFDCGEVPGYLAAILAMAKFRSI